MSQAGQWDPRNYASEFQMLTFVISQWLQDICTATLVQVVSCSNDGAVTAVGTVTVQPLVNQMTGNRTAVPHGELYGLPYLRIQGGANAVIIDPQVGDIGIAVFASRDISSVKATKAQANPGSLRQYDWSDGLYLGGLLNGVPMQYFQFTSEGITVVSPTAITLQAPQVTIDASSQVTMTTPLVAMSDELTVADDAVIGSKDYLTHRHSGVQTGSGDTGPIV